MPDAPKSAPTLADVARLAGVSTATVSRCLNFPERVAAHTREQVAKAIESLGYSPNFGARVMAARRTNTIGAIIPTIDNAIFATGVQAFQEELGRHGFVLLVASSSYRPELEYEQIRALVARGADALMLIGHARDAAIYAFLDAQKIPALVTWAFDPAFPRPSIGFDNRGAMQALARHVLSLGHRQIALISAHVADNDRAEARVAGVQAAMREAGLDPAGLALIETYYGIESGATAFAILMAAPVRPTVVLCGNDVLAVGALQGARNLGLRVPEDVSITGFDDMELAMVAVPPLTSVQVPHAEMGRAAARALVDHLTAGKPITGRKLETRLCLRASLGPPPTA